MTTTGDIIYEASASTAARLPVGSAGQVLTVAGGIPSWATPSTGAGTITRTDFTATSGQTVFTVAYTVGLIDVYQNGAKLAQADFTATNGTSFTLATGATTGDLIQAEVFSSLNIYSTITAETFNGTGSQTIFTMSAVPANSASLLVAISGVVQDPTTYTVSSNTLTFSTAPPSASGNIAVRYLGVQSVSTVSSFSAGTTGFTPSTATTGAVVLAGTLNVANGGTGVTTSTGSGNNVLSASPTFTGTVVAPTINAGAATALTLQSAGTTAVTVDTSQRVGIGITTPLAPLHVVATAGAANDRGVLIQDRTAGNGGEAWLSFKTQQSADDERIKGAIVYANAGSDFGRGNLLFCLNNADDNANATISNEQMRISSAGLLQFNSGYGSVATAYGCRAWVNFNGQGTIAIRGSGNVSSITDNGTGDYTVNLTTAMPDINYTTVAQTASDSGTALIVNINSNSANNTAPTTSATRMITFTRSGGTLTDSPYVNVSIFR
jgi:hypothetical protein